MKRIILLTILLATALNVAYAVPNWYYSDSLVAMPTEDSIPYIEEYSAYTVVRSIDTATTSMLWGITENDTLHTGILTDGIYSRNAGKLRSRNPRDFSRWCVYAYHSGIWLDSTKRHTLYLGSDTVYRQMDSTVITDTLYDAIEMEEIVFIPGAISRLESNAWQSYLAMKYGVTLDYALYIASNGDTLWHPVQDESYYHRIVGIGSDSIHQWRAMQSVSKEDATMLLVAHYPLQEGQYALLGDDDGDESWTLKADGSNLLSRTWKLCTHNLASSISIVWHPTLSISQPNTVSLSLFDSWDAERYRLRSDSIVGDSAFWFTIPEISEPMILKITGIDSEGNNDPIPQAVYSAASGTISISSLDPNKVYSYALYTQTGQLLFHPASSVPTAISVGLLPTGIYRIEAFDGKTIIASLPLINY